jgi:hypothetical protein
MGLNAVTAIPNQGMVRETLITMDTHKVIKAIIMVFKDLRNLAQNSILTNFNN